jgi:hypothetical protein
MVAPSGGQSGNPVELPKNRIAVGTDIAVRPPAGARTISANLGNDLLESPTVGGATRRVWSAAARCRFSSRKLAADPSPARKLAQAKAVASFRTP